jgi:hypothetical protein
LETFIKVTLVEILQEPKEVFTELIYLLQMNSLLKQATYPWSVQK